jgi:hypothetical protein
VRVRRGRIAELLGVARSLEHSLHQVVRLVVAERPVVPVQADKHADLGFVAVARCATSHLPAPPGRVALGHVAGYGLGARSGVAFQ